MNATDDMRASAAGVIRECMAPLLLAYTVWVLNNAVEKSEKLYFVARDAQVLWKIAKICASSFGLPIRCNYLFGSRRSWSRSIVRSCSHEELLWSYGPFGCSVIDALKRLGVDSTHVDRLERMHFDVFHRIFSPDQYSSLTEFMNLREIKEVILHTSGKYRNAMIKYMEQQGLLDDESWALVDVGWTLGAQSTLTRGMADFLPKDGIRAYYLCVAKNRVSLDKVGIVTPFVTQPDDLLSSHLKSEWIFSPHGHAVLEYIAVRADHETTVGFAEEGGEAGPIFDDRRVDEFTSEMIGVIQSSIESYVKDTVGRLSIVDLLSREFCEESLDSFRRFCIYPSALQVRPFASMSALDGAPFDSDKPHQFIRSISIWDLVGLFGAAAGFATVKSTIPPFTWWPGCAAISGGLYSKCYRAIHREKPIMPKLRRSL